MYIPKAYRQEDQQKLVSFMKAYPFATIVTGGEKPLATHLPFIVETNGADVKLVSHMAASNPQWLAMSEKSEVLIIFQGPHAYISATFYPTPLGVPTWNYVAVHAYGTPVIHAGSGDGVLQTLLKTIAAFEPDYQKQFENMPVQYTGKLMTELIAFEINVTSLEGAFKLSQDKTVAVQENIAHTLTQSDNSTIAEIGRMIKQNLVSTTVESTKWVDRSDATI